MTDTQRLDAFTNMVAWSKHVVFLGGAGVSTESGIPDFRSKDGLYHKIEKRFARYQPEYLLSYECLRNEPDHAVPAGEGRVHSPCDQDL